MFTLRPWSETEDPIDLVASRCRWAAGRCRARRLAVSDRAWATFVLALQAACPAREWLDVVDGDRALAGRQGRRRDRGAGRGRAAADRVAAALLAGEIPARSVAPSRRCREDIGRRPGRRKATSRSTSPSSAAAPTRPARTTTPATGSSGAGEAVVCDFGGTLIDDVGYCSDITRTVVDRAAPSPRSRLLPVLQRAQQAAVAAAGPGSPRGSRRGGPGHHRRRRVRRVLHPPHRSRHRPRGARGPLPRGRQRPAAGSRARLLGRAGHLPAGRFGARIEDIVVVGDDGGPRAAQPVDHDLVVVEA